MSAGVTERAPAGGVGSLAAPVSWKVPVLLAVLGVGALLGFGVLGGEPGSSAFGLSLAREEVQITPVSVPTRVAVVVLSLLVLGLAGWSAWLVRAGRRPPLWVPITGGLAFVLAFLVWAAVGETIPLTGLLRGSLLLAVPLVFGALSGVLCERAGVINIGIEGQLLAGAFVSAVLASLSGSVWLGLLAAPVAGLAVGFVLAAFAITYRVDQIIVGVVLNVLVIGLTSFVYSSVLVRDQERWNTPERLPAVPIPLLSDIPVLGPVLFDHTVVVYLMYVAVAVVHVALFMTRWGLRVRAVGEHPTAADTVGIRVNRVRFTNVLLGGAVAGLGGAFFTLGAVGAFGREMTAGKGFIALAAMIFGRYSPLGALAAALLFGFADNLQNVLASVGTPIPSEFLLMAPYLATIFAVAGLVGRVRVPAADGIPYPPGR